LPLKWTRPDGTIIELETAVTGTVSLDADKKGINMEGKNIDHILPIKSGGMT
jgi:hypothetical protein